MSYQSIDVLQNLLANEVFGYARDSKKAAGRALGTFVEIISFHLLEAWGFGRQTAMERRLPEYANPHLTHNVEFTLHPRRTATRIELEDSALPFTARKICRAMGVSTGDRKKIKDRQLLSTKRVLRNACTIYESGDELAIARLEQLNTDTWDIGVDELSVQPFAMFECKRVGVEEGMSKGPQTIEKAKQGAYVARSVSSLQRFRKADGSFYGIMSLPDSRLKIEPYNDFLAAIVHSNDKDLLRHFILTIGVVSNHGNWFTSNNRNKELEILAQSYDWLLFLSDDGLARFMVDLLLDRSAAYQGAREAFMSSYSVSKRGNSFTKVTMDLEADRLIRRYFNQHLSEIEQWFQVVSPTCTSIGSLKKMLHTLAQKDWQSISQ